MAENIITRVRLLIVGVLLVLSFIGVAQTQKRCLSVEGNGYVRVATSLSNVVNSSTDFCVNFDVKDGGENINFVIKPGGQYYLEKIEVEDISGNINEVPQERIYAERDDSLHFQCYDSINLHYFFIFKEVQPWPNKSLEGVTIPYRSRDARYCQIYRASDLGSRATYEVISIQNNIESVELDNDNISLTALPECNSLKGNNKTFKNSSLWQYPHRSLIISDLHILSGASWTREYGTLQPCSFVRCTANPTKWLSSPIFFFI